MENYNICKQNLLAWTLKQTGQCRRQVHELKDVSMENFQLKDIVGKKVEKNKQSICNFQKLSSCLICVYLKSQKEKKEKGRKHDL